MLTWGERLQGQRDLGSDGGSIAQRGLSYRTSPDLSFLTCDTKMVMGPTSLSCWEDKSRRCGRLMYGQALMFSTC